MIVYKREMVRFILLVMIYLSPNFCLSQDRITGYVIDNQTKISIPFATVFLSNTLKGMITDSTGMFTIKTNQQGNYELIISSVGYESIRFVVNSGLKNVYKILLTPKSTNLNEVTVKSKRSGQWHRNLDFFKKT